MTRRFLRSTRGETLVEFALALTTFLMIIFGTIEFGLAVWRYNMLADFAQEGARYASVRGSGNPSACTSLGQARCQASAANVQSYVQSRASGLSVTVTTTPAPSTITSGATVTVVVQNVYTPVSTALIPHATLTMTSTAKMIMAR